MRLRVLSSVLLPQPDGPINAVMCVARNAQVDVLERMKSSVIQIEVFNFQLLSMLVSPCQFLGHVGSSGRSCRPQSPAAPRPWRKPRCTCRPSPDSTYICTASVRPELISSPWAIVRHGAGGIDQGGGFAHNAADGQNHARQNAAAWPEAARCANTVRSLPAPRPKLPSR